MNATSNGFAIVMDDGKETLVFTEGPALDKTRVPVKHSILIVNKMFMQLHTMVERDGESHEALKKARDYASAIEHQIHGLVDAIDTEIELSEKNL